MRRNHNSILKKRKRPGSLQGPSRLRSMRRRRQNGETESIFSSTGPTTAKCLEERYWSNLPLSSPQAPFPTAVSWSDQLGVDRLSEPIADMVGILDQLEVQLYYSEAPSKGDLPGYHQTVDAFPASSRDNSIAPLQQTAPLANISPRSGLPSIEERPEIIPPARLSPSPKRQVETPPQEEPREESIELPEIPIRICFEIHYNTSWGENLFVSGNIPELGSDQLESAFKLEHQGLGFWRGTLELPSSSKAITYRYLIVNEKDGSIKQEFGHGRTLEIKGLTSPVRLQDHWRSLNHPENPLFSKPFTQVFFRQRRKRRPIAVSKPGHTFFEFRMGAVRCPKGCTLALVGNHPELGNWDAANALLFDNSHFPTWKAQVSIPCTAQGIEYKYGWYDPELRQFTELEGGDNRRLAEGWQAEKMVFRTDEQFHYPDPYWKGAGVAIPVFSLRTLNGLGVGEFSDLIPFADWAAEAGLKIIQVLPVNDTTATHSWMDSYPYAAISVFALHPLYLNLDRLASGKPLIKKAIQTAKSRLEGPQLDYESVMRTKLELARQVFDQEQAAFLDSPEFETYFEKNQHWLEPYALFCYLRDREGTSEFTSWGPEAKYHPKLLDKYAQPGRNSWNEISFQYFLQFHLDLQLQEAAEYIREKGLVLKGDLPIGIYRNSADAWVAPELYNMDAQAGAPPDPFSENGQNWGFPTYRWEVMAKDNYLWWRQRMTQLARYFDTYRIDHILGFFRIWQIPMQQVEGIMGRFNPAIPLHRTELEQRGIPYEFERFCKPYIRQHLLEAIFGEEAATVKQQFLVESSTGVFQLRPEFDTQRKVADHFAKAQDQDKAHLQEGLFDLLSNVLLLPVEGGDDPNTFHPRIELFKTSSYDELDNHSKDQLYQLYVDYFYHRQEQFWREQAMEKLPALRKATDMLICGEDLGMVPSCAPGVMQELAILSLEIQRMSKNPQTEFLAEQDIPYWSVISPSTHDMAPIRAWWEEEDRAYIQRFYQQELHFPGEAPSSMETYIATAIIEQHLRRPSMLAIFPIQDLLAMDEELRRKNPFEERINVPSNPKNFWRYRLHLSIEELQEAKSFSGKLRSMIETFKR